MVWIIAISEKTVKNGICIHGKRQLESAKNAFRHFFHLSSHAQDPNIYLWIHLLIHYTIIQ